MEFSLFGEALIILIKLHHAQIIVPFGFYKPLIRHHWYFSSHHVRCKRALDDCINFRGDFYYRFEGTEEIFSARPHTLQLHCMPDCDSVKISHGTFEPIGQRKISIALQIFRHGVSNGGLTCYSVIFNLYGKLNPLRLLL